MKQIYIRTYPNGMQYVGQTANLADREAHHHRCHKTSPVGQANRRYKGRIETKLLFVCDDDIADFFERRTIETYDTLWPNGYNMQTGGNSGYQTCEETGQKISKALLGRKLSEEHCHNLSENMKGKYTGVDNYFYGRKHTDEAKRKISAANTGRRKSEEEIRKTAEANRGRKHTEEAKKRMSDSKKGEKNPNYGKTFSEEYRKKLSDAGKGRKKSKEHIRKVVESRMRNRLELLEIDPNYGKGKHLSEEHRRKMSEAAKRRYTLSREKQE